MEDPTRRRSPGSWPRDRPIRWRGVAGGLLTTLYTAWSWVLGRWRVVLGPIVFGLALVALLGSWRG